MAQYKLSPASKTPLNGSLGPNRIFDFASVSLDEIKAIRKRYGVSVNDVVLAIVAGAVRRFMILRSVDPNKLDFRVSTPVNVRTKDDEGKLGNRVSSWIVPFPLDEPDPAKQLARIHEHTEELKDSHQASAVELVNALHEWVPFDLQGMSSGTQNMIVTNVPGRQYPLYLLGGELLACTRSRP